MKTKHPYTILVAVGALFLGTGAASSLQAQATRTWVSGVGDDANPCSRTAPCKTFAGAISKTAANGEINVLDPGGFGTVTITKAITISSENFEGGVLTTGTNGIIVNVPNATDVVVLRGLDLEGLHSSLSGITVIQGGTVHVEKCTINAFTTGINFVPTVAGSQLHVVDTIVRNNGAGFNGQGILVNPSAAAKANLNRVQLENNVAGIKVQGDSNTVVNESFAAQNAYAGFSASGSPAVLTVERSVSSGNGTGIVCAAGTTVRLSNNAIIGNTAAVSSPGTLISFQNNDIDTAISATPANRQ